MIFWDESSLLLIKVPHFCQCQAAFAQPSITWKETSMWSAWNRLKTEEKCMCEEVNNSSNSNSSNNNSNSSRWWLLHFTVAVISPNWHHFILFRFKYLLMPFESIYTGPNTGVRILRLTCWVPIFVVHILRYRFWGLYIKVNMLGFKYWGTYIEFNILGSTYWGLHLGVRILGPNIGFHILGSTYWDLYIEFNILGSKYWSPYIEIHVLEMGAALLQWVNPGLFILFISTQLTVNKSFFIQMLMAGFEYAAHILDISNFYKITIFF